MQHKLFQIFGVVTIFATAIFFAACGGTAVTGDPNSVDPNETAATVNGKVIKMEEVDRAVKMQAQGQESKMSPLELAAARLQVLQSLVEQEVMFQEAEKEKLVPTQEEISAEINRRKSESRMSAEEFDKQMAEAGMNAAAFSENVKKGLAIQKLVEKITGRIDAPKDKEISDFFAGNPELFVKKRGVRLAAIVVDPSNSGEGDTTTNDAEATVRVKEIMTKLAQPNVVFSTLASEYSEDPSKFQGGDLGFLSETDLRSNYPQLAAGFMSPQFTHGQITNPVPINGRLYIFKLMERIEKEEAQTLESPGVRQQIIEMLGSNRKQLLAASFQAVAMNKAKIENFLAQKVVDNPNELSGARPAGAATPSAAANTATNTATNTSANTAATNANASPAAIAVNKPANTANTK